MKHPILRWAQLCVAATVTAVFTTAAGPSAASLEKITVKRGDTLGSLASKHRITKKDLARVNEISIDARLSPGTRLVIPDSPRVVVKPAAMRRPAKLDADRVALRRGPHEDYKRITLFDAGERLIVTRRAGEWLQVRTSSGDIGWIRGDYVKLGSKDLPLPKTVARKSTAVPVKQAAKSKPKLVHAAAKPATVRRKAGSAPTVTHDRGMPMYPRLVGRANPKQTRAQVIDETRVQVPSDEQRIQLTAEIDGGESAAQPDRSSNRTQRLARGAVSPSANPKSPIIRTAYAYRGVRYRFGGMSRRGIDCSGFTSSVFKSHGVMLPRTAREQFTRGEKIPFDEMQAGDLVFFHTTRPGISHVGIYIGSGKFIHASTRGRQVRVDSIMNGYYRSRFRGARRMKQME